MFNTLGNHFKAHNPVGGLLVFFHILSVVVKDEGEVVVQVELKQIDIKYNVSHPREERAKLRSNWRKQFQCRKGKTPTVPRYIVP